MSFDRNNKLIINFCYFYNLWVRSYVNFLINIVLNLCLIKILTNIDNNQHFF